jgi:hypothetical protein
LFSNIKKSSVHIFLINKNFQNFQIYLFCQLNHTMSLTLCKFAKFQIYWIGRNVLNVDYNICSRQNYFLIFLYIDKHLTFKIIYSVNWFRHCLQLYASVQNFMSIGQVEVRQISIIRFVADKQTTRSEVEEKCCKKNNVKQPS